MLGGDEDRVDAATLNMLSTETGAKDLSLSRQSVTVWPCGRRARKSAVNCASSTRLVSWRPTRRVAVIAI